MQAALRALGPDPDSRQNVPRRNVPCAAPNPYRDQEAIDRWKRKRVWCGRGYVMAHWATTVLLNFLAHKRLASYKEETDGLLGLLYLSALVSMVLYWTVVLSDPGFIPIRLPGRDSLSSSPSPSCEEVIHEWDKARREHQQQRKEAAGRIHDPAAAATPAGAVAPSGAGEEHVLMNDSMEAGTLATVREEEELDPLLVVEGGLMGTEEMREWAMQRKCTVCGICHLPIRAKHCKKCQRCVRKMDHHCIWTNNCVGEENHMAFCFYLLFQGLHLSVGLFLLLSICLPGVLTYLNFKRGFLVMLGGLSFNIVLALPEALWRHPLLSFLLSVVSLLWVFVNGIFINQVRLISSGLLYSEAVNRRHLPYLSGKANPFDKGVLRNWLAFLRPEGWTTTQRSIVSTNTSSSSGELGGGGGPPPTRIMGNMARGRANNSKDP